MSVLLQRGSFFLRKSSFISCSLKTAIDLLPSCVLSCVYGVETGVEVNTQGKTTHEKTVGGQSEFILLSIKCRVDTLNDSGESLLLTKNSTEAKTG